MHLYIKRNLQSLWQNLVVLLSPIETLLTKELFTKFFSTSNVIMTSPPQLLNVTKYFSLQLPTSILVYGRLHSLIFHDHVTKTSHPVPPPPPPTSRWCNALKKNCEGLQLWCLKILNKHTHSQKLSSHPSVDEWCLKYIVQLLTYLSEDLVHWSHLGNLYQAWLTKTCLMLRGNIDALNVANEHMLWCVRLA